MLTVAGIGPGNPEYLNKNVEKKIINAGKVLAFSRIAETLKPIRRDIIKIRRVDDVFEFLGGEKDILLLASGDPNFYGIVNFLKNKGVQIYEVIPGISSFQYMMSRLQKPWQSANFLSLHGRDGDLSIVKKYSLSIILIDRNNTPSSISRRLYKLGIVGNIYAGYNLSYDDEVIIKKRIGQDIEDISSLGVVLIENEVD